MAGLFETPLDEIIRSTKLGPSLTIDKARFLNFLTDTATKRICFNSTHQSALKEWAGSTKYPYRISLPFRKTIGPIVKDETGIELHDSRYGGVWCGLDDTDAEAVRAWIMRQGGTVFLRDLLDLSVALSNHFGEGGKVLDFYETESRAKYQQDSSSIDAVADAVRETISRLPFYKDADAIACVPPRPTKDFDLPSIVAKRASSYLGKQFLICGQWLGDKGQLKELAVSEKWDQLENAQFSTNTDLKGKSIVLIDDLYQSGCTLHFVASKLKSAGAARIFGLSLIKSGRNTDNQ